MRVRRGVEWSVSTVEDRLAVFMARMEARGASEGDAENELMAR